MQVHTDTSFKYTQPSVQLLILQMRLNELNLLRRLVLLTDRLLRMTRRVGEGLMKILQAFNQLGHLVTAAFLQSGRLKQNISILKQTAFSKTIEYDALLLSIYYFSLNRNRFMGPQSV